MVIREEMKQKQIDMDDLRKKTQECIAKIGKKRLKIHTCFHCNKSLKAGEIARLEWIDEREIWVCGSCKARYHSR